MKLKPHTERVLRDLLAWDRSRVAATVKKAGRHFPDYSDRQDRAEAALADSPDTWSLEVREFWQSLVEAHGDMAAGAVRAVHVLGLGVQPLGRSPETARDFRQLVAVADEIGVLPVLRGAGSRYWRTA